MSKQNRIDTQKKGGRPKLELYQKRRHQFKVSYNDTDLEKMEMEARKCNEIKCLCLKLSF